MEFEIFNATNKAVILTYHKKNLINCMHIMYPNLKDLIN